MVPGIDEEDVISVCVLLLIDYAMSRHGVDHHRSQSTLTNSVTIVIYENERTKKKENNNNKVPTMSRLVTNRTKISNRSNVTSAV